MRAMSCVTQCSFRRRCSSFGMRVAYCVQGSSAFAIRPPSSSTRADALDHAEASDGGERSSPSNPRSQPLPSSALPSRQRPLADDLDHQGATFRAPCDDADRSSPSACCLRHFPATSGSRNSLLAERGPGLRSRGFVVSASSPPCRREIYEYTITGKGGERSNDSRAQRPKR